MPDRLRRIPDGETGHRLLFTTFQAGVFAPSPTLMYEFVHNAPVVKNDYTPEQIEEGIAKLANSAPLNTGYDEMAIASYAVFKKLKDEGVLNKAMRLQVSIPTPPNVITPFVQAVFQAKVEPIYQAALNRALRKMQDEIPHSELAIQIDLAVDTAFWEGFEWFKPWFGDGNLEKVRQYTVDYIIRMIGQVDEDVELGIHNCYGDMEHRHWKEPESLATVVERGLQIFEKSPHKINFFHAPVAKSALDHLDSYFAPLKDLVPALKKHNTELYLGVIHYNDMSATRKMIDAATTVLGDYPFGVATECGWGRTPPEQIEDIMKMSTEVSQPVM